MNVELLVQIGFSEIQAKIYLFLIKNGQSTPAEIAEGIDENRTTVYSAAERLENLNIIIRRDRGKISAYVASHPSTLESIAEKRLRMVARQAKNLESNLPSLINFYNEHQNTPGVTTFYGKEGVQMILNKVLATKKTLYFFRSRYDSEVLYQDVLNDFKTARVKAKIKGESIAPSDFTHNKNKDLEKNFLLTRTLLPASEYDSPIEIDIFGDNVAFINFGKDGMSTLIESPEIADAMRQIFLFTKKHINASTKQNELNEAIEER